MPGFMLVSGYFSFKEVENGRKLMVGYRKSVERYLLPFLTWFILVSVLLNRGLWTQCVARIETSCLESG